MPKKKTQTTQTNQFSFLNRPENSDTQAARSAIQNVDFTSPVVHSFAQAEGDINDAFYEDDLTDGAKEKIKLGRLFNLRQQKGAALSQAKGQEANFKAGNMMSLAGLTQAPLVNTGSSGTQSVSDPMGWTQTVGNIGVGAAT